MGLIQPIIEWWRKVTCQHLGRIARFRIEEEIGIGYWQCTDCGHEWEDD